jgi:hypothetical protein
MQNELSRRRPYGGGSVFTHRGAWYGQWRPYPGAKQVKRKLGAKRQPGSRSGLTRKQAEARLRTLMDEVRHATPDERLDFETAAAHYIEHASRS